VIRVRIRGVKYRTKYRNPVNQLTKAAEPKLTENAMVLYGLAYIFYNLCLPPTFPLSGP
jgi:hypothetical protein